jgi:F-type H+-transporting ATPase subunit b
MELIQPGIGLIFWMTLSFFIVIFILKKFAWKPILNGLKEREKSIEEALNAAEKAREAMKNLKADNEKLLQEAKEERDNILRDARKMKENIITEAKEKAQAEANRIVEGALVTIENEKNAAVHDLKNQIATLSIEIAEKILKEELKTKGKQKELIDKLISEIKFN